MLLFKILMSKQGKWQFVFAGLGFLIGICILFFSMQMFLDLRQLLAEQKKKQDESSYIIINKKLSLLNTFDKSLSNFSEEEIAKIDSQQFVKSVGAFVTNRYDINVNIELQEGLFPFFFEAVPDKYIDDKPEEFTWDPSKKFIPIIASSEFLKLYNFGFAMTQGMAQLPPEAVKSFTGEAIISGNGKRQKFKARVVGFSDRIPSVLVPMNFMEWANKKFGQGTASPSRLILEVPDPGDEQLVQFLKDNKYQANKENLRKQRIGNILQIIVTVVGAIGLLFVVLSFIIFLINFQLIISRANEEIRILINLGYPIGRIIRILNTQLGIMLILIIGIGLGILYQLVKMTHGFLSNNGFMLEGGISPYIALIGLGTIIVFLILSSLTLRYSLVRN